MCIKYIDRHHRSRGSYFLIAAYMIWKGSSVQPRNSTSLFKSTLGSDGAAPSWSGHSETLAILRDESHNENAGLRHTKSDRTLPIVSWPKNPNGCKSSDRRLVMRWHCPCQPMRHDLPLEFKIETPYRFWNIYIFHAHQTHQNSRLSVWQNAILFRRSSSNTMTIFHNLSAV